MHSLFTPRQTYSPRQQYPRIVIVHDALVNTGGAERVLTYMHEAFPNAPIITSVYLPHQTYAELRSANIIMLPGGKMVTSERRCKQMFPLWLLAFRRLDLSNFDIVLTSTSWGAKFIRPGTGVRHACYCYAPFRLLWNPQSYAASSIPVNRVGSRAVDIIRTPLKQFDLRVTQAIPRIATTCRNMAQQIAACYQRQTHIIYAPIRLSDYHINAEAGTYYLTVSRLISHKRVDLAIRACNALGRTLIVVGDGPDRDVLKAIANDTVQFAGRISDARLKELYAGCRAVIFPSDEDYGLVPLEAQASGRPVIAYGAGGALETIRNHETGILFPRQDVAAVIEAIETFERNQFDPQFIRRAVEHYDVEPFKQKLCEFILSN